MAPNQAMKQMLGLNKALFDNTFNGLALFQERLEKMMAMSLEQALTLPQEGKKVCTEWFKTARMGGELFKKTVDDSCQKLEAILS